MSKNPEQEPECSRQIKDEPSTPSYSAAATTSESVNPQMDDIKPKEQEPPPRIKFHCETCDINELCDYVGTTPPFVNGLVFAEDCYVMRDPFAAPPFRSRSKPEYFIVLGANCVICGKIVCKRPKCSIFYQKTFCRDCAMTNVSRFPSELQGKFSRQLAS